MDGLDISKKNADVVSRVINIAIVILITFKDVVIALVIVTSSRDTSSLTSSLSTRLRNYYLQPIVVAINTISPNVYHHQCYITWYFINIIITLPSSLSFTNIYVRFAFRFGFYW
jgi:hypothetical protein